MRDFYTENRKSKIRDEDLGTGKQSTEMDDDFESVLMESDDEPIESGNGQPATNKQTELETELLDDQAVITLGSPSYKQYYIQVGAYSDSENIDVLVQELVDIEIDPMIVQYKRSNYNFYGVLVPAGKTFALAKATEKELLAAGFTETIVVGR